MNGNLEYNIEGDNGISVCNAVNEQIENSQQLPPRWKRGGVSGDGILAVVSMNGRDAVPTLDDDMYYWRYHSISSFQKLSRRGWL